MQKEEWDEEAKKQVAKDEWAPVNKASALWSGRGRVFIGRDTRASDYPRAQTHHDDVVLPFVRRVDQLVVGLGVPPLARQRAGPEQTPGAPEQQHRESRDDGEDRDLDAEQAAVPQRVVRLGLDDALVRRDRTHVHVDAHEPRAGGGEGVGGEVVEISLLRTTLLETGNWTDSGHPTGRKVTFVNSFAIEGHYFNFSTSGQCRCSVIG